MKSVVLKPFKEQKSYIFYHFKDISTKVGEIWYFSMSLLLETLATFDQNKYITYLWKRLVLNMDFMERLQEL